MPNKKVRITESKLLNLINKMVEKTVENQTQQWMLEVGMPHSEEDTPKTWAVEFWFQHRDQYDYDVLYVEARSEEEAIHKCKTEGGAQFVSGRKIMPPRTAKKFSAEPMV
jgi:hypothetical protein